MFTSDDSFSSRPCHCGNKKLLSQCHGVYLQEQLPAPTAEKLMRSHSF